MWVSYSNVFNEEIAVAEKQKVRKVTIFIKPQKICGIIILLCIFRMSVYSYYEVGTLRLY